MCTCLFSSRVISFINPILIVSGKKIWLVSLLASFVILEFVLTTCEYSVNYFYHFYWQIYKVFFYKGWVHESLLLVYRLQYDLPLKSVRMESFLDLLSLDWLLKLTNSINAVTDILITAALIALLHRSRTGFRRSDNMINRLILFTVNTGALTSILAIIIVIMVCIDRYILIILNSEENFRFSYILPPSFTLHFTAALVDVRINYLMSFILEVTYFRLPYSWSSLYEHTSRNVMSRKLS